MSKYRYILLDWDGNLAKTLDVWLDACRMVLAKRGIHLSDEEIATCFGMPLERFAEWGIKDLAQAIEEMESYAKESLPNVELYPDALAVLEELRQQGKTMALITTSKHDFVAHLLEKYNMLWLFDAVIAGDDVMLHKPHPEPLEKALEKIGGNKETAIMVGDSDKDLGAALNAGIDSVLFYPAEHKKFYNLNTLQKLKPTFVIDDFKKLLDIV